MNKTFIALATAISIAPGVASADSGGMTTSLSQAMDSPAEPEASIFTDVPGIGLVVPTTVDPWGEQAMVAFDPLAQRSTPGLHLSRLLIIYAPSASLEANKVNPPEADTFSVLLAGVGVMGLIAQRKSRLRWALAR